MPNQQLANEFYKPIIRKVNRKFSFLYKDNIWGVDLADIQLIVKYNKRVCCLLCAIDFFSNYAWVVPIKDKKVITIVNAFQSILDSSKKKPNKIQDDQGSEFYNSSF